MLGASSSDYFIRDSRICYRSSELQPLRKGFSKSQRTDEIKSDRTEWARVALVRAISMTRHDDGETDDCEDRGEDTRRKGLQRQHGSLEARRARSKTAWALW